MRRAAVFAHYDKDNIIDDYVIYYLNGLKKVAEYIVFVSCCELSQEEKEKLNSVADYVIAEKHEEYDFGSYKRGYLHLLKNGLEQYDELIFANDSCYGPFNDFGLMFGKMENSDCDFWGITKNKFGCKVYFGCISTIRPHIQSYFLVFRKNVFSSSDFEKFMKSIQYEENKKDIITKYEIGLTEFLKNKGFKDDVFIKKYYRISNSTILKWRQLILKCGMPLMKCSTARLVNRDLTTVEDYPEVILRVSDYPVRLIAENVNRTKVLGKNSDPAPLWIKKAYFDFLGEMPYGVKKILARTTRKFFPNLMD